MPLEHSLRIQLKKVFMRKEKKKTIKFFVHLKDILRGARGHVPPLAPLAPPLITISLHDLFNKGHANECP